jgi:uncharacterized protein with PQ loop repeat
MIDILAWVGALLSCLLSLPQAVQALRSGRLEGVSGATYWITLGNAMVWAAWAVLAGEWAAGVPALVNGPAAVLILGRLRRLRAACSQLMVRRGKAGQPDSGGPVPCDAGAYSGRWVAHALTPDRGASASGSTLNPALENGL